ncbi:MAG: YqgE/AlgH family protein [Thermodesulfovibrionales bacterium]
MWAAAALAFLASGAAFAAERAQGTGLQRGVFLVASREMPDPRFMESVILLVEYSRERGAMGLIINRPTDTPLSEVFPDMEAFKKTKATVYFGGPVEMAGARLLVMSGKPPDAEARMVIEGVYLSDSAETLERMARGPKKGEAFRVYAGYSGWTTGQLEREIEFGSWHVMGADRGRVFAEDPSGVWDELIIFSSGMRVRAY